MMASAACVVVDAEGWLVGKGVAMVGMYGREFGPVSLVGFVDRTTLLASEPASSKVGRDPVLLWTIGCARTSVFD